MPTSTGIGEPSNYLAQVTVFARLSVAQLVRASSHSRRAEAARNLSRQTLWLAGFGADLIGG